MEALLYLAAQAPGAEELSIHTQLDKMVGVERAHWAKVISALAQTGGRGELRAMVRAVAQVTSRQGVDTRLAAAVCFGW